MPAAGQLSSDVSIVLTDIKSVVVKALKFCRVEWQQIWGNVADFTPTFSAVHLGMQRLEDTKNSPHFPQYYTVQYSICHK